MAHGWKIVLNVVAPTLVFHAVFWTLVVQRLIWIFGRRGGPSGDDFVQFGLESLGIVAMSTVLATSLYVVLERWILKHSEDQSGQRIDAGGIRMLTAALTLGAVVLVYGVVGAILAGFFLRVAVG